LSERYANEGTALQRRHYAVTDEGTVLVAGLAEDINRLGETKRLSLGRIADLLDRNGIDLDEVGKIQRVSLYQSLTKNDEGEAELHDLTAIQFSPKWAEGPEWPVIQPGPPVKLPARKPAKTLSGWRNCAILPDMQIGYYRGVDGQLQPTHDEQAIKVALDIVKDANPTLVVLVGDNLDLPEMSKYRLTAPYQQTTQATIDRATLLGFELREAAPDARIVWLAGNHEERLPRYLIDNASAAFGLRRGSSPESWPVMSVPFLCRLDESNVEYLPGYPASHIWITENLKVIHGDKVASGGSTAHKYLATQKVSVIYGHIHRREWAERTRDDHDGPSTILAASPGCLARIDGAVPSTKGGVDLDGRPLIQHEDWQQGLAIIPFDPETNKFCYEQIAIHDGWAMWRGKNYGQ
jgi:predicted phosphodiesterase